MALTSFDESINRSIVKLLKKGHRYRCLILQSNDLSVLETISTNFEYVSNDLGESYYSIDYTEFFDEIGAKVLVFTASFGKPAKSAGKGTGF